MWSHRDNEMKMKMISEPDTCRECGSYIPGCGWEPLCDDCARDVHERLARTPCSPSERAAAFRTRLNEGIHAAITDPALRITIYRIVETLDQETTSVFWDSDEHFLEFVGDGWALEFHQENYE